MGSERYVVHQKSDMENSNQDSQVVMEENAKPVEQRCPIANASLAITSILYHQFEVDKSDLDDPKIYQVLESRTNYDRAFRPLLLQWSRLHTTALLAFFRLWRETRAESEDFDKVAELVRALVYHAVGKSPRTRDVQEVEDEMTHMELSHLRNLQMDVLEQSYELAWGSHLG